MTHLIGGEAVYKAIIEKAVDKAPMNFVFDATHLYQLRYDKGTKDGLNWITNQALHIVTTDKRYTTPDQELNFVYSTTEDYEKYWKFYYAKLPYLLFYAVTVIDEIVFGLLPEQIDHKRVRAYRRIIVHQVFRGVSGLAEREEKNSFNDLLAELIPDLIYTCTSCQAQIEPTVDDLIWFAFNNVFLCPNCKHDQLGDPTFRLKFHELD
ncbi:LIM domain-containing protein [Hymenobacter persicinus]|uniref:Uncharacterized protein n=1 Tax=Hymenobacter persicinus TaxID=2025506 RepID=A0A4Q5LD29_9BACT|nr:hypothetical protein [Hymenobacter persicinus]RYU81268.1 hypothetical protein EWM57_06745 [Hymenobacter persicinus]